MYSYLTSYIIKYFLRIVINFTDNHHHCNKSYTTNSLMVIYGLRYPYRYYFTILKRFLPFYENTLIPQKACIHINKLPSIKL